MKTCSKCNTQITKYTLICPNCNKKTDVTLTDLVKMLKSGDVNALEEIIRATENTLMFHARSYVKDETDAKDVVQNAYIKAYNKITTVNPDKFMGWIKQIVANESLNFMNSAHERYNVAFTDLEKRDDEGNIEGFEAVDETLEANPEMKFEQSEKERMLFEILDSLPDKQRIVIIKSYYEDMKIKDIASELSINENTVKTLIRRAKESIKEAVEELQKKEGIKLYGLSPLTFFLWLLKGVSEAETSAYILSIPASAITAAALSSSSAASAAITTAAVTKAAGGILSTVGGKIAVGVLAATLTVSGGAAVYNNVKESKNETIIEHTHDYEIIDTIEATCEHEGIITFKCKQCDDMYDEKKEKLHDEACAVNEEAYKESDDIMEKQGAFKDHSSLGHTHWSEYVLKEATCESAGTLVINCEECDYYYTEEIEKLYGKGCNIEVPEHTCNYQISKVIDPTCYEEGWTIYSCLICGDSYSVSRGYLRGPFCPVDSGRWFHTYFLVRTDEPTCDSPGTNYYECTYPACPDSYTESIPQLTEGCEVNTENE